MTLSVEDARALARRTVERCGGEAEVIVTSSAEALTRFANGRINQNVSERDTEVRIRAVDGERQGAASTNRLDEASLDDACAAALAAARNAPADDTFPGLPDAAAWRPRDDAPDLDREFGPQERAAAVGRLIEPATSHGAMTSAGKVQIASSVVAVASSRGVDAFSASTGFAATVLAMGAGGGSGWASYVGADAEAFDAAALGHEAADLAVRSANAGQLDPGDYAVVLAPDAVGEMLSMLAWTGLSAQSFAEGRSFLSDRLGERIMSEAVTIADDALAPDSIGLPFDSEGQPKRRVEFVSNGVANAVCTDSYWAHRLGIENTGHALPAPNAFGPYPLDLRMEPGDATIEELIADVERGVFVTRFWYVNVDDPVKVEMTGMTRDGTFLIENGELTRPVKNLRFTQGAIETLGTVRGVSKERRMVGDPEGGAILVPSVLLDRFTFTGQTR